MEKVVQVEDLENRLLRYVRTVMQVQDVTVGGSGDNYAVRYRGQLVIDSDEAYQQLEPYFKQEGTTLVFRREGDMHVILAIRGVIEAKPSNPLINLALFIVTLFTVLLAGISDSSLLEEHGTALGLFLSLPQGIPFAASMLAILLAHEFGHYLAARYHKTPVTLPYFIPFPGGFIGTMGAFIRLKAPPRNRRILHDIGIAGPLAGMVVAVPLLLYGLSISAVEPLPSGPIEHFAITLEGNSLLYLAMKYLVKGQLLPAPLDYGGLSPLLYWLRYFFLGLPTPYRALDVTLHPIAWAGWVGLLVTALNLIPAGQLDGGHVIFVLFGQKARRLLPVIVIALLLLGFVWPGWYIWAGLIFFLGRTYAQPLDDITPLDPTRKWIAVFGLILFVLVFTPVPIRAIIG
jgi:membrane-associated protease RseP (regulator of RpoE activity)